MSTGVLGFILTYRRLRDVLNPDMKAAVPGWGALTSTASRGSARARPARAEVAVLVAENRVYLGV